MNEKSNGATPPPSADLPPPPRTMFTCAYTAEGGAHFNYSGTKPNLIEMLGLWVHAGFNMFNLWQETFGGQRAEKGKDEPRIVTPGGRG